MRSIKQKLEGPEREGSESSNWSRLPQDISESILKLLSLRDYLQFGLVCTCWRTIVANAIASKHYLPAPQVPLLILNRAPDSNIIDPCFFDLSKQKLIYPKKPLYKRSQYCAGSFEGWFFMVDNADLLSSEDKRFSINPHSSPFFLLNPISGDRIVLPSQLTITPHMNPNQPLFTKIVASSGPNCQDCIVVGLLETNCHLALCKLVNKCWTLIEAKTTMVFLDIEIIGKTLYALIDDGGGESTIFYDLEDANAPKFNMLTSLQHKPKRRPGITARVEGRTEYVTDSDFTYLARDNVSGELLMIRMLVDYASNNDGTTLVRHILFIDEYVIPPRAKEFRVWKMDKCDGHGTHWLELDDLDGRLLYFKGSGSIVISNTSLNDPQEFVKRNCIYFISSSKDEWGSLQIEIGRFCMTDKSMKLFRPSDLSAANQATMPKSFWFIPNIS